MSQIRIVAELRTTPETRNRLLAALEKLVKESRAEKGNISYELLEDINNPGHLVFLEAWESEEAIRAHNQTSHFREFKEETAGLPTTITLLKELASN